MAPFDDKNKDGEGGVQEGSGGSPPATHPGHLNSKRDQREGSAIASKPTKGGRVGGNKIQPDTDSIDQAEFQKPKFPREGTTMKKRKWKSSRGAKIRSSGPMWGGPKPEDRDLDQASS